MTTAVLFSIASDNDYLTFNTDLSTRNKLDEDILFLDMFDGDSLELYMLSPAKLLAEDSQDDKERAMEPVPEAQVSGLPSEV